MLTGLFLHQPLWLWLLFFAFVIGILVLDLGVFVKKAQEISAARSLLLFTVYALFAGLFCAVLYRHGGAARAEAFATGYVIELGLSVDNVFVIGMIFAHLNIPAKFQHRVLFWGVLGALVLRGVVIVLGGEIVEKYNDVLLLFAAFLIYSGVKMIVSGDVAINMQNSRMMRFFRHYLRITGELRDEHFFVREQSTTEPDKIKLYVTPLFLALLLIEFCDAAFAVDSVPAILAVSHETFAVYACDIFAVLGLRALYFLLTAALSKFNGLQSACAVLLILIGIKIVVNEYWFKVDDLLSLVGTFAILGTGVLISLMKKTPETEET